MMDDIDREMQRARWRRNKARQRRRAVRSPPAEPSAEFIRLVLAERNFRLAREYQMWRHPDLAAIAYRWTHLEFSADVWAANVVLCEQYGGHRASPTKIVNWMIRQGLTHGCKPNSLRTMVYRAFDKIERLQTEPFLYTQGEVIWPPFSLDEAVERDRQRKLPRSN